MRIRTTDKFAYRKDIIEDVASLYGRNKTDSMMYAADDVERFVETVVDVLEDEDLSLAERRALLEAFNATSPRFTFDFEASASGVEAEVSIDV